MVSKRKPRFGETMILQIRNVPTERWEWWAFNRDLRGLQKGTIFEHSCGSNPERGPRCVLCESGMTVRRFPPHAVPKDYW